MIPKSLFRAAVVTAIASVALFGVAPLAGAHPRPPKFGPMIESYADYDGQSTCDPEAKPGVLAFQRIVLEEYPNTTSLGISRDCDIGGQSEHKEGRAWDWGANASSPSDKRNVDNMLDWLLDEDKWGNDDAMFRRFGLMYMIWNRRIWMPYSGWEIYCVEKKAGCVVPGTKDDVRSPHTDHVHYSFAWTGALKESSYWNPNKSMLGAFAANPVSTGYWTGGRNADIVGFGESYDFGGLEGTKKTLAGIAPTPTGAGYWLALNNGRIRPFGDADGHGGAVGDMDHATDIDGTSTGEGYWLASSGGRVIEFGDALHYGDKAGGSATIVDFEATPSGLGYWLFSKHGRVFPFGDAEMVGDAREMSLSSNIKGAAAHGADGYWMTTESGLVLGFGSAVSHGEIDGDSWTGVGIAATPSGEGYWLLSEKGKVREFGDAVPLGSVEGARLQIARPTLPAGFVMPAERN